MKKVVWLDGQNIFVVRKGFTTNTKISNGRPLVQTYTFSVKQWQLASTRKGFEMKEFFALDESNCLDCPYSGNAGNGKCYTHKFMQYAGFLSMLRSIKASEVTPLTSQKENIIEKMCTGSYVRFGTYGEPSLVPLYLIRLMAEASSTWTGYTHQYKKRWAKDYNEYFMASAHNAVDAIEAKHKNYRSFISTTHGGERAVTCPASKEAGFKSNCASCGLCSGILGKGKTNIKILEH